MPIYLYKCCVELEKLQSVAESLNCPICGKKMEKQMTYPAMVKIKGMGGYPSRRRMIGDTAPYSREANTKRRK